jgi:hypothetical protein
MSNVSSSKISRIGTKTKTLKLAHQHPHVCKFTQKLWKGINVIRRIGVVKGDKVTNKEIKLYKK